MLLLFLASPESCVSDELQSSPLTLRIACGIMLQLMVDQYIHLYEKLPLSVAGVCMGLALVLGHAAAFLWPKAVQGMLAEACAFPRWGQVLLTLDFIWIALLLWDSPSNPLCMNLFDFNFMRGFLLIACPIVWYTLCFHSRQNLFGRAAGLFLLLLGIVPLTAAYLKEPATRLLIPIWWYPVLTVAILWVPKPYLLRDGVAWLGERLRLFRVLAFAGLLYGIAVLACAILYWS